MLVADSIMLSARCSARSCRRLTFVRCVGTRGARKCGRPLGAHERGLARVPFEEKFSPVPAARVPSSVATGTVFTCCRLFTGNA